MSEVSLKISTWTEDVKVIEFMDDLVVKGIYFFSFLNLIS